MGSLIRSIDRSDGYRAEWQSWSESLTSSVSSICYLSLNRLGGVPIDQHHEAESKHADQEHFGSGDHTAVCTGCSVRGLVWVPSYNCCPTAACAPASCYTTCRVQTETCYRTVCETVYEPQEYTSTRTVYEQVTENVEQTCYRTVTETAYREEAYTVCRPVTETAVRQETYCVQRPVVETMYRTCNYTVQRPSGKRKFASVDTPFSSLLRNHSA